MAVMKQLFADTFYWIASVNPGDDWHERAIALTSTFENVEIVTTEEVLTEVLTFFATRGTSMRRRAIQLVKGIMRNPGIIVLPQTHASFVSGIQLYENRLDKGYSLPDCISMTAMRKLGIQEVLTHDHHFAQEGFILLLKDKMET